MKCRSCGGDLVPLYTPPSIFRRLYRWLTQNKSVDPWSWSGPRLQPSADPSTDYAKWTEVGIWYWAKCSASDCGQVQLIAGDAR